MRTRCGSDPPAPPGRRAPSAEAGAPVLSAVISADERRSAIFNGRLVNAG